MKTNRLLPLLVVFFLCLSNVNAQKGYYAKSSVCQFTKTIEKRWRLTLNADSSFKFIVQKEVQGNNQNQKEKVYYGKWNKVESMLYLEITYPKDVLNSHLKYQISGNRINTTFNWIDYFEEVNMYIKYLDFIEVEVPLLHPPNRDE